MLCFFLPKVLEVFRKAAITNIKKKKQRGKLYSSEKTSKKETKGRKEGREREREEGRRETSKMCSERLGNRSNERLIHERVSFVGLAL